MSAKPCSRAWQAEAVLDGLLSRADVASFERHAAACVECSAERTTLARLESVARRLPTEEVTQLRRRALHNELLRRANELSVGRQPSGLFRLRVLVPIFAGLLGLVLLFVVRLPGRPSLGDPGVAPAFELNATANSRWRVVTPGSALRLALQDGTFAISVRKLEKNQRFVLTLPDGELEVRGTRFTVECDARRTRRVQVEEGRVALRLAGQAELSLGAGQSWPPKLSEAAPVEASLAAPSETASAEAPPVAQGSANSAASPPAAKKAESSAEPRRATAVNAARGQGRGLAVNWPASSRAAPAVSASAAPGRVSEGPSAPSAAARDFAQAMSAFSHGDFGTAERLFRAFEQRYPTSPHAEDVLFLRALGRSRRGDPNGARLLAREYLQRYPGGFRADEARQMARDPAPRAGLAARPGLVTYP